MKIFIDYFSYLIRHKFLVFKLCLEYRLIWQGIIHDWTKFLPSEFVEYSKYFASGKKTAIEYKWLEHLHKNKHHWQYWVLLDNEGKTQALRMPDRYVKEMIADWLSVAIIERTQKEAVKWVMGWYEQRREQIVMHPDSRRLLEEELRKIWQY